jgi:hypothetical protein
MHTIATSTKGIIGIQAKRYARAYAFRDAAVAAEMTASETPGTVEGIPPARACRSAGTELDGRPAAMAAAPTSAS